MMMMVVATFTYYGDAEAKVEDQIFRSPIAAADRPKAGKKLEVTNGLCITGQDCGGPNCYCQYEYFFCLFVCLFDCFSIYLNLIPLLIFFLLMLRF